MKKTINPQPVCESMTLVGELYSIPNPANGKAGFSVWKLEKNGKTYIGLQPFEKWNNNPQRINDFIQKDVRIKLDALGRIRIHGDMQNEMLEQINSGVEDQKENSEILAMNIQKLFNEVKDIKSMVCKILINTESLEKTQILMDKDLNKFRSIFQIWNGQHHTISNE